MANCDVSRRDAEFHVLFWGLTNVWVKIVFKVVTTSRHRSALPVWGVMLNKR